MYLSKPLPLVKGMGFWQVLVGVPDGCEGTHTLVGNVHRYTICTPFVRYYSSSRLVLHTLQADARSGGEGSTLLLYYIGLHILYMTIYTS
jgi:hypothetical protein